MNQKKIPPAPKEMEDLLMRNEALWQPFQNVVFALLDESSQSEAFKNHLNYLKQNNESLLNVSDQVTKQFEITFSKKIIYQTAVLIILIAIAVIVFVIGFFIVNLIVQSIRSLTT